MPDPFHLAFPVTDLEAARRFYADLLGCGVGRSSDRWIDFDFFGHQLVDQRPGADRSNPFQVGANMVDGHEVPVPHFGVVLSMEAWKELAARLSDAGVDFIVEPYIRFLGEPGEQGTMFFRDPSGNALEFKAFADPSRLFAT